MKNIPEKKEILIIKNITREDTGLLGDIIREQGISYKVIDLSRDEKTGPVEKYGAVVVLGGPDSANDGNLKMGGELEMISQVLSAGIPFLGICLGMQTMVKASGGLVVKSPVKEVGFRDPDDRFYDVQLTKDGREDPLFDGIDETFNAFHLHGETVILTEDMKLLAEGRWCRNQIVKTGINAYGIQCHFELTPAMYKTWITEDPDLQKLDIDQLTGDFDSIRSQYEETGRQIFRNFIRIAGFM